MSEEKVVGIENGNSAIGGREVQQPTGEGVRVRTLTRLIAVVLFGVIIPVMVLLQAYHGIATLAADVNYTTTTDQLGATFSGAKKDLKDGNDYALFSLLYTEHANQKTMINKQVMKVAIMQIGFAVISIGMMLIVLGINDGGAVGSGGIGEFRFDIKTGSTGVAVFLVGSAMATAGGVLKNEYSTVPIPAYHYNASPSEYRRSLDAYRNCKKLGDKDSGDCFIQVFEQINQGALK